VKLVRGDYKTVLREYVQPGDFVYLDPPYYPVGGYADFKRYTKEFFYGGDHFELRREVDQLVEMGCKVLLTNSNTDFVRRLYDGHERRVVDTRRNISSKTSTRTGQDLIIIATQPVGRMPTQLVLQFERLMERFTRPRYTVSK
jgi:DNA adenine methylase